MAYDSDYMPDEGNESSSDAPNESKKGSDDDSGGETFLVPKSAFQGQEIKPGDEFIFEAKHIYADEVECAYSKGDEKKSPEKPEMEQSMADMGQMATA